MYASGLITTQKLKSNTLVYNILLRFCSIRVLYQPLCKTHSLY